jgi:hypothetical protein
MLPIVNGLKEQYREQMAFVLLNAGDEAEGETAFKSLRLGGHPASLIFASDGEELFRELGSVTETNLVEAISQALGL